MNENKQNLEIFKGKVVCPLCDGNGLIYKAEVDGVDEPVYVCDECDALWIKRERINSFREETLGIFLSNHCINEADESKFTILVYDWINEGAN